MRKIIAVHFLALFSACVSLHKSEEAAKWKSKCAPVGGTKAEACVYETGGKRDGTIFYLHGLADSVKTIEASIYPKDGLIALIKETGFSHVAVISYGKDWLLKPSGNGDRTVDGYIKVAEGLKLPKPYVGIGISMGGANLATIAMQRPDFFERVVLAHPMLVRDDQYDVGWSFLPGFIVDNHFSRDEWRVANPFTQLEAATEVTKLFVTACAKDGFKLFDGTADWVSKAQAKGIPVVWRPVNDGCEHSAPSFAGVKEFLE